MGTRPSPMATEQTGRVARAFRSRYPDMDLDILKITSEGDAHRGPLSTIGGRAPSPAAPTSTSSTAGWRPRSPAPKTCPALRPSTGARSRRARPDGRGQPAGLLVERPASRARHHRDGADQPPSRAPAVDRPQLHPLPRHPRGCNRLLDHWKR
ncbi:hypothetical protein [Streptomyces bambusae]